MPDELSVRQWQELFRAGAFNSKDTAVQREAGWWNWYCCADALAGRLRQIAPVVMGIKSPFILDQCSVWFCNESTDHKLVYDSARFEPLHGSLCDLVFMVDHKAPRQSHKWTLYTKRFGFHASEFGCGHVHDMVRYIDNMAHELEQGIMPPFLAEKAAAVEYILLYFRPGQNLARISTGYAPADSTVLVSSPGTAVIYFPRRQRFPFLIPAALVRSMQRGTSLL